MARKYRSKGTGVTGNRDEARANRKLQLIVNNSFPGERGQTILEKMEDLVVEALKERVELQHAWDLSPDDGDEADKLWENVAMNAGKIRGHLEMLAIMRSTSPKVELQRAKARKHHGEG